MSVFTSSFLIKSSIHKPREIASSGFKQGQNYYRAFSALIFHYWKAKREDMEYMDKCKQARYI